MKSLRVSALVLGLSALGSASCIDENVLDVMADSQPRAGRYKESVFFEDGLSMMAPPEGTVSRERITQNAPLTTGRLADGAMQPNGEALPVYLATIPMPVTRKFLEIGRKRYDITCGTCHGPVGDGVSIVGTQMALRPPPSLVTERYIGKPAGYLFEVASRGFGMMASYAAELTVQERWAVIAYIRALQLSQSATVDQLPPEVRQKLESAPAQAVPVQPVQKERP
jgi:hypothetical protein